MLGTTISLVYRAHIAAAAAHPPPGAAGPARDSLQAAIQVAHRLGAPGGGALETAARLAFTDAMNRAALIGGAVSLAAALVALVSCSPHGLRTRTPMVQAALIRVSWNIHASQSS